jgi:ribosomal protein S18 acetylase RimI-like enzyme
MIRAYDPSTDKDELWELKRRFELELGNSANDDEKSMKYQNKIGSEYQDRYLEWARYCIESDSGCISVAEKDNEIVGYAFVLPEDLSMIWDAAVLNEIFVKKFYRGTEIANKLMSEVVETAEDQDLPLDRLVLDVGQSNERAQAFYDRYGFDEWGELLTKPL